MTTPLDIPPRKVAEQALRDAGYSHRVARKIVAVAWPHVVDEARAEAEELRAEVDDLKERIRSVK